MCSQFQAMNCEVPHLTVLLICSQDMEAGAVSVRLHHGGPQGAKPKAEVVA